MRTIARFTFNTDAAKAFGVDAAALLDYIYRSCENNKKKGINFHDGRYWMYNSAVAFSSIHYYMSPQKAKRELAKLESGGAVLVGNYSGGVYSRTKWYTISDAWQGILADEKPKKANGARRGDESSDETEPPTHCSDLNQPLVRFEPTHCSDLNQPLVNSERTHGTDLNQPLVRNEPTMVQNRPNHIHNNNNIHNTYNNIDNSIDNSIDSTSVDNSVVYARARESAESPQPQSQQPQNSFGSIRESEMHEIDAMIESMKFPTKLECLLKEWMRHKKRISPMYNGNSAYNQVLIVTEKVSLLGVDPVYEAVRESIANGWGSIVFERVEKRIREQEKQEKGWGNRGYDWDALLEKARKKDAEEANKKQ